MELTIGSIGSTANNDNGRAKLTATSVEHQKLRISNCRESTNAWDEWNHVDTATLSMKGSNSV